MTPQREYNITVEFCGYGLPRAGGVRPAVYRVTASDHTAAPAGAQASLAELLRLVNPDSRPDGARLRLIRPTSGRNGGRAHSVRSRQSHASTSQNAL